MQYLNKTRLISKKNESTAQEKIETLLRSTGRENIETVISWLADNHFYTAPASVVHHNNFQGGLAKHSLEVCQEAMRLNKEANLPESSTILCSILHDVCKADQYVMINGRPRRVEENIKKGHGKYSVDILKSQCKLPLNYDEAMAIWWHMGKNEPSKDKNQDEYNKSHTIALCRLIRQADYNASHNSAL